MSTWKCYSLFLPLCGFYPGPSQETNVLKPGVCFLFESDEGTVGAAADLLTLETAERSRQRLQQLDLERHVLLRHGAVHSE